MVSGDDRARTRSARIRSIWLAGRVPHEATCRDPSMRSGTVGVSLTVRCSSGCDEFITRRVQTPCSTEGTPSRLVATIMPLKSPGITVEM